HVVPLPVGVAGVEDKPSARLGDAVLDPRLGNHPANPRLGDMPGAAFFDLDRTLIRRSSALALAGSFRERGMISRRRMAHAPYWQLIFVARGADEQAIRAVAERGLHVLNGFSPDELQRLVADAMEPVLKPLVYAEPLELVEEHRERGEPVYIVSAALQEIV